MKDRFLEVVKQYAKHQNYQKVADIVGLTRQRVHQIMEKAREKGLAPIPEKTPPKSHAELMQERRDRNVENGMCPNHAQRRRVLGSRYCKECQDTERDRSRQRREDARAEAAAPKRKRSVAKKTPAKRKTKKK